MIFTTIYRMKYHWTESDDMNEFDKTAKANGYEIIGEDSEGRTYEFRKDYHVGADNNDTD
jgi:uncharacterized membrane protein